MPQAGTYGPRIPTPDYPEIARKAKKSALGELGLSDPDHLITNARPERLAEEAARVMAQADAELATYIPERDAALAHLWFYERRAGLGKTIGVSQTNYRKLLAVQAFGDKNHPLPTAQSQQELAEIAKKLGVPRVRDAEKKLIDAATRVHAAHVRRETGLHYFQESILGLTLPPYEWTPDRIAEHTDVDPKTVYRNRTLVMKRHGLYEPRQRRTS